MITRKLVITIACLLIATTAEANDPLPPDLCAEPVRGATGEPYADREGQTISRFCDPRVDPPVLDKEVCCSVGEVATCKLPDAVGRCTSGMKFWCEHGEAVGGKIECYQDGPSTCAAGLCKPGQDYIGNGAIFDDSSWVCCQGEDDDFECMYVGESGPHPPAGVVCDGSLTVCSWGATNEDGTVDCLD
ncbi:MAG: hypothetical protein HC927_04960 [Deltaproteobacteria bacterium]|nr:hypothetical protein [Deltaproteobacteria bacterium]